MVGRIVLVGSALALISGFGGCTGGPGMGGFVAAGSTFNAMNAASRGNAREAAGWAGLAEYGRAQVIHDAAAEAGRGRQTSIANSGTAVLQMGDLVYRGEVLNGLPHGTGKLQFPDGMWFEGDFRNGFLQGRAKTFYPDGATLEAFYERGDIEGLAIHTNRDGSIIKWYEHKGRNVGENEEEYRRALEAE